MFYLFLETQKVVSVFQYNLPTGREGQFHDASDQVGGVIRESLIHHFFNSLSVHTMVALTTGQVQKVLQQPKTVSVDNFQDLLELVGYFFLWVKKFLNWNVTIKKKQNKEQFK